jgi:hypothetical protein
MRPVYPIDRVDAGRWFSPDHLARARSLMQGWVLSLARTGR